MGKVQEAGKIFRVSVRGEFDFCKPEHEKEHINLKGFAFCLKTLKPVMVPTLAHPQAA